MKKTVYDLVTGRLGVQVECSEEFMHLQYAPESQGLVDGGVNADEFYVVEGVAVAKPERPSADHFFDYSSKSWVDRRTVDDLKGKVLAAIEVQRVLKTIAPIEYRGSALDADKKSQDNITGKLQEIRERAANGLEMPVEMLFWRDADNIDHAFANTEEYREWLGGLAIAITERGTMAYAWAWQMKAVVAAAQTAEELQALNLI